MREQLHHIEQITWVLPVQGGHKLAAVHVLCGDHGNLQVSHQHIARSWRERGPPHRQHRAPHDIVHFDLDLHGTAAHQQLGLARCSHRRMDLKAPLRQTFCRLPDGLIDPQQRLIT